jgi:SOS-response transcriptional repressor LexA
MKGLTKRQEEVLKFIAEYLSKYEYPPSYQDIADRFGIASKHGVVSKNPVQLHVAFVFWTNVTSPLQKLPIFR